MREHVLSKRDETRGEIHVIDKYGNKSLWITEDGVKRARAIMTELGIEDWERQ